ncbi:MAG: outer membrane lipid asymmetry maintenance protein MlaD [Alphaproteobacteria bacterium]
MTSKKFEALLGLAVVAVALAFFAFGYSRTQAGAASGTGMKLHANFLDSTGLSPGSDVRVSGVKVGSVSAITLDPQTYLARVEFSLADGVILPVDSSAKITSEGLLGGRFLALEPGAEEAMLEDGGQIEFAQSSPSLEQLLGQVIFNLSSDGDGGGSSSGGGLPEMP